MSVQFIVSTVPTGDGHVATVESAAKKQSAQAVAAPGACHLGIQSMRKAWIYSKATGKTISWYHWLPGLGLASAAISAVTATAVFTNLSSNPATWAKVVVGSVAVLVAGITALQSWTASRMKSLVEQAKKFHKLYRAIETRLLDKSSPLTKADIDGFEADLNSAMEGMISVSNRRWNWARAEVDREMKDEGLWKDLRRPD